jgi:FAD/FMN-containing dehydrogenase
MRDAVLGVEAVLADGSIVTSLTRLVKNSTGFDPRFLFIGTEGTLGIITRLTLRLHPPMGEVTSAWVTAEHFEALPALLRSLKDRLGASLCAFEFMSGRFVRLAARLCAQEPPLDGHAPWHVLIEAAGPTGQSMAEALEAALSEALERDTIADCAIAASLAQQGAFWRLRESIPEVLSHLKPVAALDIGMPWAHTAGYIAEVEAALHARVPAAEHLFLGHLGDNNLHLISGPVDERQLHDVDEIAYGALRGRHGTISAEHGVGRVKKPFLAVSRHASEIDLMKRLKHALDPRQILNPGRIVDLAEAPGDT